jgi:hypothetical protein
MHRSCLRLSLAPLQNLDPISFSKICSEIFAEICSNIFPNICSKICSITCSKIFLRILFPKFLIGASMYIY